MSLSGSESGRSHSERQSGSGRVRQRKLFRKRDKRSRSSERYDFSDLDDDVFVRGPRKLRREDVEGELSYDYTSPGYLKVFTAGLNRCSGLPEFRTVLVSAVATAADVIHEVLQRCDILYDEGDEFFLCEVIGKLEPYQNHQNLLHQNQQSRPTGATHFVEQCRRIIGPEEHVLVIQALWKPLYGYYRRFELKQASRESGERDGGRSRRRRRVRLWRTGGADFFRHFDIDDDDRSESSNEAMAVEENGLRSGRLETRARTSVTLRHAAATQVEPGDPPMQVRGRSRAFGTQTETIYFASADHRLRKKYPVPLGPYLLLLKGFDSRHDLLVNDLFDVNLLGSDDRRCDVHLRCGDVQPEHCVIEACHSEVDGGVGDGGGGADSGTVKPYCMSVAPIGGSEVLLNGQQIDGKQFLTPGDVISIGAGEMCSYVFMFKDASQVPDRSVGLSWLMFLESIQRSIELQQQQQQHQGQHRLSAGSFASTTVPSDSILATPRDSKEAATRAVAAEPQNREADAQQLAQASLGSLLALYFGEAIDLQFAAGLLALMAVYVTDLELELASAEIQWHLTDSVVTLSKKAAQMQDLRDKAQCYAEMIQACALAFEIFLFFHEICSNGLTTAAVHCQQWHDFCETTMQQMLDNIFNQLGEEVMTQSSALCDTGLVSGMQNPAGPTEPSMEGFLTLLTQVSQAFANAQCACVSTLRLMVMKRLVFQIAKNFSLKVSSGDPSAFLQWSCAVQLRVNVDQLEEWLRQEGLDQFLTALDLPNSLVDLVATPKSRLVTMSWKALRATYPLIPPSLLHHTLTQYDSGSGPIAGIWRVCPEDRDEASYSVTCAIEDHFQLAIEDCRIPVEQVKPSVQLWHLLEDPEFSQLTLHLDSQTAASNCRLQWRHIADHIRRRLGGNLPDKAPHPLGDMFTPAAEAPSVAASAAAVTGAGAGARQPPERPAVKAGEKASSSVSDEVVDDSCLYYDSLSDEGNNRSSSMAAAEAGIAAVAAAQNGPPRQQQRPKTPTPENPFAPLQQQPLRHQRSLGPGPGANELQAGWDEDEEEEEDGASLVDSFTLANTIRNELLGHRISGGFSEYTVEDDDERTTATVTERTDGAEEGRRDSQLVDSSSEGAATSESLYWQHTRSFASMQPPQPPPPPPPPQAPPSPPPRSWSLNSRRCQAVVAADTSLHSSQRAPRQRRRGRRAGKVGNGSGEPGGQDDDGEEEADLFFVTLTRTAGQSFGMELIDGEKTDLSSPGVFIRSVGAGTPASSCQRLKPGHRILAVNNQNLASLPYARCLSIIKQSETVLHLLVSRSHPDVVMLVLATAC